MRRISGLGIFLGSALLLGCTVPEKPVDSASALLAVPVRATQAKAHAPFNDQIAAALRRGEDWPRDATLVALKFAAWGGSRQGALSWQGTGERPSRYRFVAIIDNMLDDSVRGQRMTLDMERQADSSWRIVDARQSWRCWRKDGDDSFGVTPCP